MKKIIIVLVFIASLKGISQDSKRMQVKGKVIVENNDVQGITILDKSSNVLAITDENGEFVLAVALNDLIEVSALQFQNITFQINEDIVKSKSMKIFLIEEINKLDEIVISNNTMSGNLATDINNIKNYNPKFDTFYFGIAHQAPNEAPKSAVANTAINSQHQHMVNGLNIVNVVDQLLLPLFRSKVDNKKEYGVPEVSVGDIKYYFGSEFLVDNFNIPTHRVEEFIRYVESEEDFSFSLLNYGNEMAFLELLYNKSLLFLNKSKKD